MKKHLSITKVGIVIIVIIVILISRNFGLIGIGGVLQTEFYYLHDTAYAYHDAAVTVPTPSSTATAATASSSSSSSSSSVEVIKQQLLLVNNSSLTNTTTTTLQKNIQEIINNNITTDDGDDDDDDDSKITAAAAAATTTKTSTSTDDTTATNNTNSSNIRHHHEQPAVSYSPPSLKQRHQHHEPQVIDSNAINFQNDLILNEKVCGVWKCFIPIQKGSNLLSSTMLLHNNKNNKNKNNNITFLKEDEEIKEIDNDIDNIGWLVIKDGKYSMDGTTGISIKDAMYETYILSEKIRRQYHIPHLLIGPPKLLINLTLQQRQLLNSKKKKKKKNPIISSSSINSTTIANNNNSYSLIVQPVKKLRKGSFLLIRYYNKQSKTGTKYIRHFCYNKTKNLNITRLSEELLLQKQLLDEYPLLAMDYQLLLLVDNSNSNLNNPTLTSNNNDDDDDHDDYSHSHHAINYAYNFDLDRYYQYYDKMMMNNNTSKLTERKITVQSWLESISKKILLL